MRDQGPTAAEVAFYDQLRVQVPELQDWYHADPDGTPWMTVSYDDVVDGAIRATWRLDFDGLHLVAGLSPSFLNWDDGVRGRNAGMKLEPEGLFARVPSVAEAVVRSADWFHEVTQGRATRQ